MPALLANPFLVADYEDTATETTEVAVGRTYYGNFGSWSNSPTQYDYWIKNAADDSAIVNGTADSQGDFVIDVGEELGGVGVYFETLARNGSGDAAASGTSADYTVQPINVASAVTAFTKTSGSGVTPMTASISFGANAEPGGSIWFNTYSDAGKTTLVATSEPYVLQNADLPTFAANLGTLNVTHSVGQYVELVYAEQATGGPPHTYTYATAITP